MKWENNAFFPFTAVWCSVEILIQVLITSRSSRSILHSANIPGNHFVSDIRNTHIQEHLQEHMSCHFLSFTENPTPPLWNLTLPGRPPRLSISWQLSRRRRPCAPRWTAAWFLHRAAATAAGWGSTGTGRRPSQSKRRWKARSKGGPAPRSGRTSPPPWAEKRHRQRDLNACKEILAQGWQNSCWLLSNSCQTAAEYNQQTNPRRAVSYWNGAISYLLLSCLETT